MPIQIGLEINPSSRAIAWALEYPGCFAYGVDGQEAVVNMARALPAYEKWVHTHNSAGWPALGNLDLRVVDAWEVYTINDQYDPAGEGYEVESFFLHDWKPLTAQDVQRGVNLLHWSREDLVRITRGLKQEQLDLLHPGERWSIRGILRHIANAEAWYLERLGLAGWNRSETDSDEWHWMEVVRGRLLAVLPGLAQQEMVIGKDGEFWSPRKLLRRALWHEIDHFQHIQALLFKRDEQ